MEEINNDDKQKIIEFISNNELDYKISNSDIFRFNLTSLDDFKFFFYKLDGIYILSKFDPSKINNTSLIAYQYYKFETLNLLLEQLSFYDKSIEKKYWETTTDVTNLGLDKINYIDDWYSDFILDDNYGLESFDDDYKIIKYNNNNYKPQLKSPYNTLHEVSDFNEISYTTVDSLYFEIHPISCLNNNEKYLLKLKCNNEEILIEYINYIVNSKKGMINLLNTIFKDLEPFKI